MYQFYKNALYFALGMLVISVGCIVIGHSLSHTRAAFTPKDNAGVEWQSLVEAHNHKGTYLNVTQEADVIDYSFYIPAEHEFPYAAYTFDFGDAKAHKTMDLTPYDTIEFDITCAPLNVLLFNLFTHAPNLTQLNDTATQRVNSTFFSCDGTWQPIIIRLQALAAPDWWLNKYDLELSDPNYNLEKAYRFSIVNSLQSPRDTPLRVQLKNVALKGRNINYLYAAWCIVILAWAAFSTWIIRRYISLVIITVKDKVKNDRQIIAYKELTITPQKNKETSDVLRFMATEYSNADMNLELACSTLGINRTKVNEILKAELCMTFNAYLNKLRMTEAARLLTENKDAAIAEVAYSAGYNNVSYFGKLFKNEYNCTPKVFKQIYKE